MLKYAESNDLREQSIRNREIKGRDEDIRGGSEPNDAKPQMPEKGWDTDVTCLNPAQEHSSSKTIGRAHD